jgi:hypothetical protein
MGASWRADSQVQHDGKAAAWAWYDGDVCAGYDRDPSGKRRQCQRARPRGARRMAQGEWERKAVQRKWGWVHGAGTGGLRPTSVCEPGRVAVRPARDAGATVCALGAKAKNHSD